MNGLGRKNAEKSVKTKEKNSIFTKETWGVILLLFTTILFVCLITSDLVFSLPGKYVREFLLGAFGYFAYIVLTGLFVVGIELVVGKTIPISIKSKLLIASCIFLIAVFGQVIFMNDRADTYGEYLNVAYSIAKEEGYACSFSGIVFAIFAYPTQALLTVLGGSIILGIAIVALLIFIIKSFMGEERPIADKKKFRNTYIDIANIKGGETIPEQNVSGVKEYPVSGLGFDSQRTNPTQSLFINNEKDFHLLSKKEIEKENSAEIKYEFTDGGLGVANAVGSYTDSYTEEMKRKIEYIKTPVKLTTDKDKVDNTYYSTTISNPIPRQNIDSQRKIEDILKPQEITPTNTNIPLFEHNEEKEEKEGKEDVKFKDNSAESNAQDFASKYIDNIDSDRVKAEPDETFRPFDDKKVEEKKESNDNFSSKYLNPENTVFDFIDGEEKKIEEVSSLESEKKIDEIAEEKIEETKVEEPTTSNIFSYDMGEKTPNDDIFDESEKEEAFNELEKKETFTENDNSVEEQAEEEIEKQEQKIEEIEEEIDEKEEEIEEPIFPKKSIFTTAKEIIEKKEKQEEEKKEKIAPPINRVYHKPPIDLLDSYETNYEEDGENHQEKMDIIKQTLEDFHINAEPKSYIQGPAITRYEIMMPAGISVRKVLSYDDDLKMRLASKDGVRIEAPIPGKNLVGIEVANKNRVKVGLKELMLKTESENRKPESLYFAIGKDIVGNAITDNLAKAPHFLVAGATGSGKSVCLNTMIISLIMRYSPEEMRLILVDPKSVGFRIYQHLPHLMIDEIITEPKRALTALAWAQEEMERRYKVFSDCPELITDIEGYNTKIAGPTIAKMPRIVVVIDELADLMESCKKDMETRIRMIVQKARAAGIHLVLATQRPSVDIITGTIKANLPSRIALKVMNFADSNTIISQGGAEKLLGNGDMLYKNSTMADFARYQGAFLSDEEISKVVNYTIENNKAYFDEELSEYLDKATRAQTENAEQLEMDGVDGQNEINDFFLKALWLAVNSKTVSTSMFQRKFQIGYSRAGGLIDKMESMGYITGSEGSKPRSVLLTREEYIEKYGNGPESM